MTGARDVALVPGELRGYRQFLLVRGGLYPLVHMANGPWDGAREQAVCAAGGQHPAPAWDCTCGLYGWYHPVNAVVAYGAAHAVVGVSGRVVMGDTGFRAAAGRVEAVTLPAAVRVRPWAAAKATRRLQAGYPGVTVYRSRWRMLRDHPPADLSGLGVGPPDRSRVRCRRAALALWALFVLAGYSALLLPKGAAARFEARWWPLLLVAFLAWQAAVIALMLRSQPRDLPVARPPASGPPGAGSGGPSGPGGQGNQGGPSGPGPAD